MTSGDDVPPDSWTHSADGVDHWFEVEGWKLDDTGPKIVVKDP